MATRPGIAQQRMDLGEYHDAIVVRLEGLDHAAFGERLWRRDAGLWKSDRLSQQSIINGLGWLSIVEDMARDMDSLAQFAARARQDHTHLVLIGMGGSSLAPLVLHNILAGQDRGLPATVLDTTDPAAVLALENNVDVSGALFLVASKSGTTAEPQALTDYFLSRLKDIKQERAGENFVAITDPDTPLVDVAKRERFRQVFVGKPDIGGRYSALSVFGLLPAMLMGIDVTQLLRRAGEMVRACRPPVVGTENPGLILGAVMGELARLGRDKLTLIMPEGYSSFGLWLEQLIAESTGKEGTGILPVVGEPLGGPSVYGADRVFVQMKAQDQSNTDTDDAIGVLRDAGHPVITISIEGPYQIGAEFFRWQVATAYAGSILGVNPFDQPDVVESKNRTVSIIEKLSRTGRIDEKAPDMVEGPVRIHSGNLFTKGGDSLWRFLGRAAPGDYFCVQAYLPEGSETDSVIGRIRESVRESTQIATTAGYGPRYLHSTGQFHKGGPNIGLFLQITSDDVRDVAIPGGSYTFGLLRRAQALGDYNTLVDRGRRIIRVHLTADTQSSLNGLCEMIYRAASSRDTGNWAGNFGHA